MIMDDWFVPTVTQLIADLDDSLFAAVLANDQHVLRYILPDRNNHSYILRPRRHELSLATKRDSGNFIERLVQRRVLIMYVPGVAK